MKTYYLDWENYSLELGENTLIMGILNITPDSFSDGGKFFSFDAAVSQGEKMAEEGADIIDIGGESTRPFSDPVSAEEEIRRIVPVIEKLSKKISIPISVDTTKADVAKRALDSGAAMINDISALRADSNMAKTAAEYNVPVTLMHMQETPKTMQISPAYKNLIEDIKNFLSDAINRAQKNGILKSKIIVDPGIGFGKTLAHNLLLLKNLNRFDSLDVPILVGSSRKAFIRMLLKEREDLDLDPGLPIVETGTQAAVSITAFKNAHIVRVHDVANTKATLKIVNALKCVSEKVD